ncbi:MAG: Rrf2 family transcriptional regulator [Chloroflexi bacterium]|nr:Rrf2 family transcriptional regulator [Chloroflexota bacterium]
MKLNTKTRYGTRALLALAEHDADAQPLSSAEIAAREGISVKYLEGLLSTLRSAGLVRSTRGAAGGYRLAKMPADINLKQVYDLFEGPEGFVECTTEDAICSRNARCATQTVWSELFTSAMQYLESISLAALVERNKRINQGKALSYDI